MNYLTKALNYCSHLIWPPQPLLTHDHNPDPLDGLLLDDLLKPQIRFIDTPCCDCCGVPFEYDLGPLALCGDCHLKKPAFDRARTAFVYDELTRPHILSFKYGGRTDKLKLFAQHLKRAGRMFWDEADYLIPVPLHPTRLIRRRFNQSALLARTLAKIVNPKFEPDALFRIKATPPQGTQTIKGRFRNVRSAFEVPISAIPTIRHAHIVLVDDVMTTGATLQSCARTLKKAGASHIDVVTLARTIKQY